MTQKTKHVEERIRKDRTSRYGDHVAGHRNLGLAWTGLIQNHYGICLAHPLPAHLVEIMMAANKANRIAINPSGRDHYNDGRIYISMAEEASEQEVEGGVVEPKEV